MQIGFIGYGNMAKALASRWAGHHQVAIGGRNPQKVKALAEEIGRGPRWGPPADLVRDAGSSSWRHATRRCSRQWTRPAVRPLLPATR
jgi:predicted dinucleotide-binding enzyme